MLEYVVNGDEKRQLIKPGDEIEFVNSDEQTQTVRVVVKGLYQYDSFEELYQHFTPIEMGYRPDQIACASPNDIGSILLQSKTTEIRCFGHRNRTDQRMISTKQPSPGSSVTSTLRPLPH